MGFDPSEPRVPKGQPGGGQWGAARNKSAAKAQRDVRGRAVATKFRVVPRDKQAAYLKSLSTDDLKKLTAIVYSHRTSDPAVVQMRIAVANEMAKRGLDVKNFGALGGGLSSSRRPATISVPARFRGATTSRFRGATSTALRRRLITKN